MAIDRFLSAEVREERVVAARWVTAWAMLVERCAEQHHKQMQLAQTS
jgi:hypothetical protein